MKILKNLLILVFLSLALSACMMDNPKEIIDAKNEILNTNSGELDSSAPSIYSGGIVETPNATGVIDENNSSTGVLEDKTSSGTNVLDIELEEEITYDSIIGDYTVLNKKDDLSVYYKDIESSTYLVNTKTKDFKEFNYSEIKDFSHGKSGYYALYSQGLLMISSDLEIKDLFKNSANEIISDYELQYNKKIKILFVDEEGNKKEKIISIE